MLTLAPVLLLALSCGGVPAQKIRMVATADGSRFMLMPTGGPPVVCWVTLIPAGVQEDPPGLEGISLALARASLAGTHALGSEDPLEEAAAVARARGLARELAAEGGKDPAVRALLAQAEAEIQRLARPLAWEKALRAAPSSGSQLHVVTGAVLLKVTTTTHAIRRVAELLKDRRDQALLRGADDHFKQIQVERKKAFDLDPHTPLRRRLLAKVYGDGPFARFYDLGDARSLTFETATAVYRRLNDPRRSCSVLAGGFDPETVEAVLKQVFERAPEHTPTVDLPRLQGGYQSTEQAAADTLDTMVLGCPIPKSASAQDLVVFASWLAGDQDSYLPDALRARGHPRVQVRATAPFPGPGGLLLLEITKPGIRLAADSKLHRDLVEILQRCTKEAPDEEQLARVRRRFLSARATMLTGAGSMALYMAQVWALTGQAPISELNVESRVSGTAIQRMCQEIFDPSRCTLVLPEGGT